MADADVPLTKAELAVVLKAALEASESRILERVERFESNLLSAFRQWSARFETRIGVHTMEIQGLDVRFAMLEERLAVLARTESGEEAGISLTTQFKPIKPLPARSLSRLLAALRQL